MKIAQERLGGAASPELNRSAGAESVERASRFRAEESAPVLLDQVGLSPLAQRIGTATQAEAAARSARVQALAGAYQNGSYTVPVRQLSQRIVSAWLGNGTAPKSE